MKLHHHSDRPSANQLVVGNHAVKYFFSRPSEEKICSAIGAKGTHFSLNKLALLASLAALCTCVLVTSSFETRPSVLLDFISALLRTVALVIRALLVY